MVSRYQSPLHEGVLRPGMLSMSIPRVYNPATMTRALACRGWAAGTVANVVSMGTEMARSQHRRIILSQIGSFLIRLS